MKTQLKMPFYYFPNPNFTVFLIPGHSSVLNLQPSRPSVVRSHFLGPFATCEKASPILLPNVYAQSSSMDLLSLLSLSSVLAVCVLVLLLNQYCNL